MQHTVRNDVIIPEVPGGRTPLREMKSDALRMLGVEVHFDWEACRTPEVGMCVCTPAL